MTTRREGQEWLVLAYDKGYRDGLAEAPRKACKTLARWIIGPVFGACDARTLRAAYVLGYSVGDEDRAAEEQDAE